ncbi:UNVERIFIED_CONTAM: hypothetical protein PYX00_004291 [Menopon gallinae]|uniref:Nuclear transcription factor Y subunit gamma n=1 Tax=Menopon gallinae TaxID=328185 RepID=A0AAW2I423_9NEOP
MSVYYVNAGDSDETVDENGINTATALTQTQSEAQQSLASFWPRVNEEIKKMKIMDLKVQALPLARIKKIMKLDEDVKMISAEAPMLFAKAAEMFIHELTLRAWIHTQDNKRRTLQRNDIAMAITKYDQFDFLIDIVPREEIKPANTTKTESKGITATAINADQVHYYFQIAQQHQQALQNASADAASTSHNENAQNATAVTETVQTSNAGQVIQTPPTAGGLQIVHQIVTPSGEVQNIPLQLTPQQLQMIRMQLQGNSNQPLILQTGPVHVSVNNPIQVAPQGTQVFITPTSQSEGE